MPRRARRRFSSEPWSSNRRWPRFFARRSLATAEHVHGEAHGAKEIRGFHEVRIPYAHSEQTEMGETHVGIGMVKPVGSCHGSSRHPSDPVQDVIRRALAYFEQTVNVFLVRGRSTRLFGGQYVSIAFVLCHLRTCIWHSLARAGSKSRYRKVVRVQVPSPAPRLMASRAPFGSIRRWTCAAVRLFLGAAAVPQPNIRCCAELTPATLQAGSP
jgi:hypothetical protein